MKRSREKPKPLTISASEAAELDRLAQVAQMATANANIAQLQHRAAYAEAILRAAGIDPNALSVVSQADGSVVLEEKK